MDTLINSLGGWLGILLLAVVVVVAIVIVVRLFQRNPDRNSRPVGRFEQRGGERPRYDSPDVQSRGGFGGQGQASGRSQDEDKDRRSGGGFGGRS